MVTQNQLKEYFLGLHDAIYVWGANGQTITVQLITSLYKSYGTSKYNRVYYDNKLNEGKGKIGADCSGSLKPISGYDTTAQGYYNRCTKKGKTSNIPRDKVVLVFKRNKSGNINHVGCYTGDGFVSEMKSSKDNYKRSTFVAKEWSDWGMVDFVSDYDKKPETLLTVDGEWGKKTTLASQKVLGTKEDSIVSNQPVSCKPYLPNANESSWEFEQTNYKKGSNLIRAIQELVGLTGRDVDGHCGKQTIKAMQRFLMDKGLYLGLIDGKLGPKTVKAWQKYINSRL